MPLFRRGAQTVLFVHIPKTGGTTIEEAFKASGWIEALRMQDPLGYCEATPQHMHAQIHTSMVPKAFYDYGFTIVRNPFARVASEYKMRAAEAGWSLPFPEWFSLVLEAYRQEPYFGDNHFRPQVEFLAAELELFRFEEGIPKIIERVFATLGADDVPSVSHLRRGDEGVVNSDERMLHRIAEFYRADFEELGYDPEDFGQWFWVTDPKDIDA